MHILLSTLLLLSSFVSLAAPLPHGVAPLPPLAIEPHAAPNARTLLPKAGPELAAMARPVDVVVVGCRLTADHIAQQSDAVYEAFGSVGVKIALHYVGDDEGTLCESDFIDTDTTTALKYITNIFNRDPDWAAWRSAVHADLIVLLRPLAPHADLCGLAWQNNTLDAAYGFAVVELNACGNNDAYTMAHELGHLFGAAHGPKTDSIRGIYKFSFDFDGYNHKGVWMHTLMSYGYSGSPLDPHFSSPARTKLNGRYNNKRTLRLTAPVIASFR